jgi:2-polyprenyl-3-methyl-5-hydroxy-6-metoxy-1,4-benzoquinol methylase
MDSNPSTTTPQYADLETASDDYASRFAGGTGAWLLKVQEQALLKLLGGYSPSQDEISVLDVGGGHGQVAPVLASTGHEVTVIGSGEALQPDLAALVSNGDCRFEVGDLLKLPFADQSFDIVTCFRLLPHIDAWEALIKELCRVAKKGVIVDYPTTQSFNFLTPLLFNAKKKAEGNTRTYRLFRHHQIMREFARNGFRRGGRIGEFFWPMVVHRLLRVPLLSELIELPPRVLGLNTAFGSPCVFNFFRK